MTELEDKATRRAQRREKQQTSNEGAEGTPEQRSSADQSQASDDAVGEAQGTKPEQRVEQIRDRNARLRAQAAEERRAKRDKEKSVAAVPIGLDASERMDDIFVRTTHAAAGWLTHNFKWLQWVLIGAVTLGLGTQWYRYSSKSEAAKSSDVLAIGLVAEGGTIRPTSPNDPKSVNPELEQLDPRPVYDSDSARLAAAEDGYRKAVATHGTSGAGWLARLGLAGVLFDQQKWDDALAQYRAVRASEIAKADPDILGRSLEGIGLSLEGKGDLDGALQAFRELTNQEGSSSLATLGLYQQARVLVAQGQNDKAKELLGKAKERLDKANQEQSGKDKGEGAPSQRPGFVAESVKMLLARIDPSSAKGGGLPGSLRDDPAKLQRILEDLQKNQPAAPSAPGGEQ